MRGIDIGMNNYLATYPLKTGFVFCFANEMIRRIVRLLGLSLIQTKNVSPPVSSPLSQWKIEIDISSSKLFATVPPH
jgi:hypothetical protein